MKTHVLGHSALNRPLTALFTSEGQCPIVLMSGLHGDEIEGHVLCAAVFQKILRTNLRPLAYLPACNPDGVALHCRWNANNVDLNRNFPTKVWSPVATDPRYPPGPYAASEPETRALMHFISDLRPQVVVDFHSYKKSVILPSIRRHGALESLIATYGARLAVEVEYEQENLGYSITGGFHDWCLENGVNNVTIEVQRDLPQAEILRRYLDPTYDFVAAVAEAIAAGAL